MFKHRFVLKWLKEFLIISLAMLPVHINMKGNTHSVPSINFEDIKSVRLIILNCIKLVQHLVRYQGLALFYMTMW